MSQLRTESGLKNVPHSEGGILDQLIDRLQIGVEGDRGKADVAGGQVARNTAENAASTAGKNSWSVQHGGEIRAGLGIAGGAALALLLKKVMSKPDATKEEASPAGAPQQFMLASVPAPQQVGEEAEDAEQEKQAGIGGALKTIGRIGLNGVPGKLGLALDAYSWSGLPGSGLAMAAGSPLAAAATAGIRGYKGKALTAPGAKGQIEAAARNGAAQAGSDLLSAVQQSGGPFTAASYAAHMNAGSPELKKIRNSYRPGALRRTPTGAFGDAMNYVGLWGDTLDPIRGRVRNGIIDSLPALSGMVKASAEKQAWAQAAKTGLSWLGKQVPKLWRGAQAAAPAIQGAAPAAAKGFGSQALKWGGRAVTAYGVGAPIYNALRNDPLAEAQGVAAQEGAGAFQAQAQQRLAQMTPFERRMIDMDPSLMAMAVEAQNPGTIAAHEQNTGTRYQAGPLAGMYSAFNQTGTPKYFQYGAGGSPNYL